MSTPKPTLNAPVVGGHTTYPNKYIGGRGSAQALVIEEVRATDTAVHLWMSIDGDGPTLMLSPDRCLELGNELLRIAAALGAGEETA